MIRPTRPIAVTALAALATVACAHAPARVAIPEDAVWPAAPAPPRVRLTAIFPDPSAPAPAPALWRRVLAIVAGTGSPSAPPPDFDHPAAVALAADGSFAVADPDRPSVTRVQGGSPSTVTCPQHPWDAPMSVAFEPAGSLLVADGAVVVRVAPDGTCTELAPARFERATGVAATPDRIYVADPPRHEVDVLDLTGLVLDRLGRGEGEASLHFPSAVAIAPGGDLLVADPLSSRVARWGSDGAFRGSIGGASEEAGGLLRPKGVAAGRGGRVIVSDAERDEVMIFGPDGAPEVAVGGTGTAPGRFAHPAGLATAGDRVLVADRLNGRIQVFELIGEPQ